jgi:hypothetical protein
MIDTIHCSRASAWACITRNQHQSMEGHVAATSKIHAVVDMWSTGTAGIEPGGRNDSLQKTMSSQVRVNVTGDRPDLTDQRACH